MFTSALVAPQQAKTVQFDTAQQGQLILTRRSEVCMVCDHTDDHANRHMRVVHLTGARAFTVQRMEPADWAVVLGDVRQQAAENHCRMMVKSQAEPVSAFQGDPPIGSIMITPVGLCIWVATGNQAFTAFQLSDFAQYQPNEWQECWWLNAWQLKAHFKDDPQRSLDVAVLPLPGQ